MKKNKKIFIREVSTDIGLISLQPAKGDRETTINPDNRD